MSRLTYSRTGSGEPMLLLHGIGDSRFTWTPVIDRLAEHYDVLAVDLPGFGDSSPLPHQVEPSPPRLAREVASWMDEMGLSDAHLVGNSLGGWIALELACLGRARTVTALSPGGFTNDIEWRRIGAVLRVHHIAARLTQRWAHVLMKPLVVRTISQATMYARPWAVPLDDAVRSARNLASSPGFRATLDALAYCSYRSGEPTVPVTIAWGKKDRLLSPRQRYLARYRLPNARVGLLAGCGHLPMWDDPEKVTNAIRQGAGLAR